MRGRTRAMAAAVGMAAVTLVAAACGGGGSGTGSGNEGGGAGGAGGEISLRGCTPQNPLVAGNTAEVCGGNILDAFVSRLVHYNAKTAAPENDIAESIDTSDNQNFTIKIKKGYKFSDGTEVKAKNFVDAWNYTAAGVNGQQGSYFFEPVEGYADTQCGAGKDGEPDCDAKPAKTDKLTGLKVVDDYTFSIKTSEKVSNLPVRLGYTAFAPQPDSFFKDPDSFKTKPIGAGPFKVDSVSDTAITLSKNPDYSGKFGGKVDKITFKIYNDPNAAYNDVVANQLDYTDIIPPDRLVGNAYQSELPDRWLKQPQGVIQAIAFSPNDPQLKNVKMREAISKAINRDEITKQIYNGRSTAADSFVSPVVDGYKKDACGDLCVFDAAKAKQLYTEAGGYKGTLTFAVNQDGGHQPMAEAVCNQLKNNLGVKCAAKIEPDFKTLRDELNNRELNGIFRSGWQMDYPSIENFLAPIYAKGAASNDARYNNPEFNKLLSQAAAAPDTDQANKLYQQAEALLVKDVPAFPTWTDDAVVGWSDRVANVQVNAFGVLDYTSITVKQ
ncbi:peptide ABC transporter substrate-binding protein [Microlunatus soli]|uniref:Oligopeptide transport system substrate-binding protein n=1 Tax=Microlunatus soli TaxID=630515 RepID=A0A1H1QAR9_9ACTN|nr:ABC transporter substrate-binding protein [Microlunatus soli]SDS20387.1 oligopeptide transport system substrate-binding protein [Microlunatus soli]